MKTLLISLVSDQTFPNLQLIKEFRNQVNDYLFISTQKMEKNGVRHWIENAAGIKGLDPLVVDEFSFDDITSKLNSFDFSSYARIFVNLTGGTKVMTLVAHSWFREMAAFIYYITGKDNEYIQVFPGKEKLRFPMTCKISPKEYLLAHGFSPKTSEGSEIPYSYTQRILQFYTSGIFHKYIATLKFLRTKRESGVNERSYEQNIQIIMPFLAEIDFPDHTKRKSLSKTEVKYLTGEWLEEYVGLTIKGELSLADEDVLIGTIIEKEISPSQQNSLKQLLGEDVPVAELSPENEIDVMFMYKNKFYTIECKTSIIDTRQIVNNRGEIVEKDQIILGETLYKADSLRTKFGLFASSYILTLTDFSDIIYDENKKPNKNRIQNLEQLIGRANLSNIVLIDLKKLKSDIKLSDIILNKKN